MHQWHQCCQYHGIKTISAEHSHNALPLSPQLSAHIMVGKQPNPTSEEIINFYLRFLKILYLLRLLLHIVQTEQVCFVFMNFTSCFYGYSTWMYQNVYFSGIPESKTVLHWWPSNLHIFDSLH